MKLSGNTILITGGSSGIGLAFARAFSDLSNTVVVCGRNAERLASVRNECPGIETFQCDISDDSGQNELQAYLANNHPDLNILINNAGIQYNYSFMDGKSHLDMIEQEIAVNFMAQVKLTDRLLTLLAKNANPEIINITSALAVVPKENAPVYCATKSALRSFTKTLRYQLEETGLGVTEIVPALVETNMTEGRGKNKISPEALVSEALKGLAAEKKEIRIGKTRMLFFLHRLLPGLADKILRHS